VTDVKTFQDSYTASQGYLVQVLVKKDLAYLVYMRKTHDLLMLMADIGGLKEVFVLIGSALVSYLA